MIPPLTATILPSWGFTPAEVHMLQVLRLRYQRDLDLFTERELAHLHFVSWLCETGRLFR